MFAMQEDLNHKYGGVNWRDGFTMGKAKLAFMDEASEFIREIESDWKWWKVNPTYHKQKALFELIDLVHFGMLIILYNEQHHNIGMITTDVDYSCYDCYPGVDLHDDFSVAVGEFLWADHSSMGAGYGMEILISVIHAGAKLLDITDPEAIYQAYVMKNNRNHQRVDEGVLVGRYDKNNERDLIYVCKD